MSELSKEILANSYWNNGGKYEPLVEPLDALVPPAGEVPDAKGKNKKLERFRKASRCYYDLFNNGLCNRAAEFKSMFGFTPRKEWVGRRGKRFKEVVFDDALYAKIDSKMDKFIIEAAVEQLINLGNEQQQLVKFAVDKLQDLSPMPDDLQLLRESDTALRRSFWAFKKVGESVVFKKAISESEASFIAHTSREVSAGTIRIVQANWIRLTENRPKTKGKVAKHGDLMPIKEWVKSVTSGGFIDYDGYGRLCTDDGETSIEISPSDITTFNVQVPDWATYVVWFNR